MIRLRVSTLESFRRLVSTDYGDEAAIIDTVGRGQWVDGPATEIMRAGTAWHRILTDPVRYQQIEFSEDGEPSTVHQADGFTFRGADVSQAAQHVGPGLHEVTGRRVWEIGGKPVQVEGTADHVRGLVIQDHKAKFSTPDARDYEPSLQWRFYLSIHGAQVFRYNLFDFLGPDDGRCRLKGVYSFRFWPYVGLEDDCREWLVRFLEWATDRGLVRHLEV